MFRSNVGRVGSSGSPIVGITGSAIEIGGKRGTGRDGRRISNAMVGNPGRSGRPIDGGEMVISRDGSRSGGGNGGNLHLVATSTLHLHALR